MKSSEEILLIARCGRTHILLTNNVVCDTCGFLIRQPCIQLYIRMYTEYKVEPLFKVTPNNNIKDTIESTSLQRTLSKASKMNKWVTSLHTVDKSAVPNVSFL